MPPVPAKGKGLDWERVAGGLVDGCKLLIDKHVGPLREENALLRSRVEQLEGRVSERGVAFKGPYSRGVSYGKGDLVQKGGAAFLALRSDPGVPSSNASWRARTAGATSSWWT